ncbi:hypothetical protein [Lentzea terrae]|uniref:hypothetical protein n=1 Tax=Lentzea terrae TaxID=2200761 RepID=UPI0013003E48|nr:hypothetical protein [Lentzea terrae]
MPWNVLGADFPALVSSRISDGTDNAEVFAGDQNGLVVGGGNKTVTVNITATGAISAIDVSNYALISFQWSAVGGGSPTFAFQQSNDGVVWSACSMTPVSALATFSTASNGASVGTMWVGQKVGKYFRFNVTGSVSGTYTAVFTLHSVAAPLTHSVIMPSAPTTAVTLGSGSVNTNAFGSNVGNSDGQFMSTQAALAVYNYVHSGGQGSNPSWDRLKVPNIAKTVTATASGNTAVWTPTSGKKFRLQRYRIDVTADAATSGGAVIDAVLRDGSTTELAAALSLYVPSAAGTGIGVVSTGWVDLGQGVLSAAANNVLNCNLSAALTAGKARVVCAGIEE